MKITPLLGGAVSGSVGGLTASRGRGGQYFRARAVPVNPNSARQQTVRSAFGSLVQAWTELLDEGSRESWTNYANATPRTDTLGQSLTLTGQQAFIGANVARLQAAQTLGLAYPMVTLAPSEFNHGIPVGNINRIEIVGSEESELEIQGDFGAAIGAPAGILIYIGRPRNESVRAHTGPWRLAAGSAPSAHGLNDDEFNIPIETGVADGIWQTPFGPVEAGDRVLVKAHVAYNDGRYSQPWIGYIVVS